LEFIGLHDKDHSRKLFPLNGYPQVYYQFLANVKYANCEDIIVPFPQTINLACKWLTKNGILSQMIYVDGSNEASDVYNDIKFSWPLLEPGGIMFGDEYNNFLWPGVNMGLNKFCAERVLLPNDEGLFWTLDKTHSATQ
jgi:hypothetical protein